MKILLVYPYFLDARLDAGGHPVPAHGALPRGGRPQGARLRGRCPELARHRDAHRRSSTATLRARKPDVVGFSILHANRWGGIEHRAAAKRLNPAITVVFGGVGATHLWEHLLTHFPEIDYIVLGEGEHTLPERWSRCLERGDIGASGNPPRAGPAPRRAARSKRPTPRPICDLDALPMPARHFDLAAPVPDPRLRRRLHLLRLAGLLGPPGPLPLGGLLRRAAGAACAAAASGSST